MKIICLLLCIFSLTNARVYPREGVNDVFDGVEGVIYDVAEYEDPEVSLFKLIARGIMPVYTVRDVSKDSKDLLNKDDKPRYQTDDIKKGLDSVITQLQEAKNKLENGNNGIYLDIDKSIFSLENLKHHLYLDLHSPTASRKQSVTTYVVTRKPSDKGSIDKHALLKASLKKYLSSDDSIYKYLSYDIPTAKLSSSDDIAALSYNFDTALRLSSPLKASVEQLSVDDHSAEQSLDSISAQDQNVPLVTEQILTFDATTGQPFTHGKDIFIHPSGIEIPPVEDVSEDKEKKTPLEDDVSSEEADKAEQGDKTLIRNKWSLKLSSTF